MPVRALTPTEVRQAWWIALGLALALLATDAWTRSRRILAVTNAAGATVRAPRPDPDSPTGYDLGRRPLVLPSVAHDARHWVMQTQDMTARGDWRVRRVEYDNAPDGREVHWASPARWWLGGVGRIHAAMTGRTPGAALERAVLWSNPLLFGLALMALVPWLARRFGTAPAALFALGSVASLPIAVSFQSGNADHHGAVLASLVGLVLGLVQAARSPAAARWSIASGVCGGVALWISAASTIPILVGLGLAGLLRAWVYRGVVERPRWRIWAAAGGATSAAAYLVEYFPDHLGTRLEVNHPWHALAWLGAGELLERASRAFAGDRSVWRGRGGFVIALALLALAAGPVAGWVRGADTFALSDPLLQTLHARTIAEFQSLPAFLARTAGTNATWAAGAGLLGWSGLVGWVLLRGGSPAIRARLLVATGPLLVAAVLTLFQLRWWSVTAALLLVAGCGAFDALTGRRRVVVALVVLGSLLPGLGLAWLGTLQEPGADLAWRRAERDVAHRLRLRVGAEPLVVAASPDATTVLLYHANARGLGTLYWENGDGLRRATALFAARSWDAARTVVQEAGVTHVVLFSWDGSENEYLRLGYELGADEPLPQRTLIEGLRTGRVPNWLRRLPVALPDDPMLRGHEVWLYEVTGPRSEEDMLFEAALEAIETGQVDALPSIEAWLAQRTGSLRAVVLRAALQARRRDERGFVASLGQVRQLLRGAPQLALDDRVRLVMVLAIAGDEASARAELRAALAQADERALRRLAPRALADLAVVMESLQEPWPRPEWSTLVADLRLPDGDR